MIVMMLNDSHDTRWQSLYWMIVMMPNARWMPLNKVVKMVHSRLMTVKERSIMVNERGKELHKKGMMVPWSGTQWIVVKCFCILRCMMLSKSCSARIDRNKAQIRGLMLTCALAGAALSSAKVQDYKDCVDQRGGQHPDTGIQQGTKNYAEPCEQSTWPLFWVLCMA